MYRKFYKFLAGKPAIYTFIIILPFLVFYWQVPFLADMTIGNDYTGCTIQEQMELQYALAHGFFPLYVPGFHGGQTSAALTLGQMYQPFPHLASKMPGYWTGNALQWLTLLRLVSLGLVHLGLFILLGRLRISPIFSFIISFITVYNLRMLDLFRMGGLENYTGYLFLCLALAFYYIKPTRVSGPVAMIAAAYLLVCGGHPQMMYYGLLGAVLAAIIIPFVLSAISAEIKVERQHLVKYFITSGICVACGILLSSAYTIPFYFDFITTNAGRIGLDYNWSLQFSDTLGGMFNNFFAPLYSDVNGAFGGSTLILLAALVPLVYLTGKKIPAAITLTWILLTILFLWGLGGVTPTHYFFWKYVPFSQNFRAPGRISMLFPFFFLLLLAWLFRSTGEKSGPDSHRRLLPYFLPALVGISLFFLYNWGLAKYLPKPGQFIPNRINSDPQWVDPLIYGLGLLSLVLVVLHSFYIKRFHRGWRPVIGILLAVTVTTQVTVAIRYGTWVIKRRSQSTLEKMDLFKKKKFTYPGRGGYGMESIAVARQMQESILEPALAKFYRKYKCVSHQKEAYRILNQENVTDTLVVETIPGGVKALEHIHTAIPIFAEGSGEYKKQDRAPTSDAGSRAIVGANLVFPLPRNDSIRLETNTFNRVCFSVEAGAPGFLAFSFPYADKWKAKIAGTDTRIYRANGYMQAVCLEAGQHKIEFRYWSRAAFVGMLISCLTFLLIGAYFVVFVLRGKQRVIGAAVGVLVPVSLFIAWSASLYSGDNLGTGYTWTSKEFPPRNNLAYAKKTSMNGPRSVFYPGLGVDGDLGKPFKTHQRKKDWWQVDLGSPKLIGEIVIYDGGFLGRKNLPLQILSSVDGKTFKILKNVGERGQERPWRVSLGKEITRFVRLRSSTKIPLSFSEVEIYPPPGIEGEDITPQDMVDQLLDKTAKSPADKEIKVWNQKGLTVQDISPMLIPLARWGTFKIDVVEDNGISMLRVRVIEPGKGGIRKLHLGYEFNRNGLNEEIPADKTVHFIVSAAISPHLMNKDNFIAVQDFDEGWQSAKEYFQSPGWRTYHISHKVRPGVKRLVLMIKFTPRSSSDQLLIGEVRLLISK
jgi:hypothetical protein